MDKDLEIARELAMAALIPLCKLDLRHGGAIIGATVMTYISCFDDPEQARLDLLKTIAKCPIKEKLKRPI